MKLWIKSDNNDDIDDHDHDYEHDDYDIDDDMQDDAENLLMHGETRGYPQSWRDVRYKKNYAAIYLSRF